MTTESSDSAYLARDSAYLARDSVNDMVRICDLSRVNTAPRQLPRGTLSGYLPRLSPQHPLPTSHPAGL